MALTKSERSSRSRLHGPETQQDVSCNQPPLHPFIRLALLSDIAHLEVISQDLKLQLQISVVRSMDLMQLVQQKGLALPV